MKTILVTLIIFGSSFGFSQRLPDRPDISKLSSGSNYRSTNARLCDIHLEVHNNNDGTSMLVTTFLPMSNVHCYHDSQTWTYEWTDVLDNYSTDAMVDLVPLSDGNFLLKYVPISSHGRSLSLDVKFILIK